MAAHVACHAVAPTPHSYPSFQPSVHNHGPVSEYEGLNLPHKVHTQFVAEGEVPEDFLPLIPSKPPSIEPDPKLAITPDKLGSAPKLSRANKEKIPSYPRPDPNLCLTPEQQVTVVRSVKRVDAYKQNLPPVISSVPTRVQPDPALAVTPEKPSPAEAKTKSSLKPDRAPPENITKIKQKVRFEIDASLSDNSVELDRSHSTHNTKAYVPCLYSDKDFGDIEFFEETQTQKHDVPALNAKFVAGTKDKHERNSLIEQGICDTNLEKSSLPIFVKSSTGPAERSSLVSNEYSSMPESLVSSAGAVKRKVVVTREFQERPVMTEYQYPFDSDDVVPDTEHVFSRPEFHNSLKVYSEMKEMTNMVPDVSTAVQHFLSESEDKRAEIGEKASTKVNKDYYSSQYTGLVELEAPLRDLCDKVEKKISLKTKPLKLQHQEKINKRLCAKEPDLLEFMSPDLQKEAPDFDLINMTLPTDDLASAPSYLAFDLYKHNRVWEGCRWK